MVTAVVAAIFTVVAAPYLPLHDVRIPELASLGFGYAALSFGAAVTGCTLALAVPGPERLQRWASLRRAGHAFPWLSDLVFVFAWAAMTQVAVVIVCFLAVAFGTGTTVMPAGAAPSHVLAFGTAMFISWYALLELTAVVRTLVQVAGAIIVEESKNS